jgi:hypothetical protein
MYLTQNTGSVANHSGQLHAERKGVIYIDRGGPGNLHQTLTCQIFSIINYYRISEKITTA